MLARIAKAIVVLAGLYCLLFQGIGSVGFLSADEPRYASIGREMAQTGDWITPHLWGSPWLEKPPLLYWMTAAAWKLGLRDEWAARFPLALVSLAFLVFLQRWMTKNFDSATGWRGAAMLASCAGWLAYSTVAVTDLPMAAAFTMAILLAVPWRERISPWAGFFLGLAVLAKALVPLVLALPVIWFWRNRWRSLLTPAIVMVAVALPWYGLCYAANGWTLVDELFIRQQFGRFLTSERQHVQPFWFYVPVLLGLLVPWTPAIASVTRNQKSIYLLALAAFGFVFFSIAPNKLPGYLLPLLPALCIAMAAQPVPSWAIALSGALAAAIPYAATLLPQALDRGLGGTPIPETTALFLVGALAMAVLALIAEKRWRGGVALVVALVVASIGWAKWSIYPMLDKSVSARQRWLEIQPLATKSCVEGNRDLAYGIAYYNGKPLPDCATDPQPIHIK